MSLKKVTTKVTYKVPAWGDCNMQDGVFGKPSKEMCRFCVKEKGYYRCALYNEVLSTHDGIFVEKAYCCKKATAGFKSTVEDVEEVPVIPEVDPKTLIRATLKEYSRLKKALISQGYPEAVADKAAQDYLLGGS